MQIARREIVLHGQCHCQQVGPIGLRFGFERERQVRIAARGPRRDGVHAGRSSGGQQQLRGVAGDEARAQAGIVGRNLPTRSRKLLQRHRRPRKRVEPPAGPEWSP